ncbi:hypothetical protein DFP73DRAFT_582579 [Morchella snyderi]|nr:hypothetical protein DFP73DRAFT_582579 [Morchella snyderi]
MVAKEKRGKLEQVRVDMMGKMSSQRSFAAFEEDELEILETDEVRGLSKAQSLREESVKKEEGSVPNPSKRHMTDQLKTIMRDGDQKILLSLKEIDSNRLDRWEGILKGTLSVGNESSQRHVTTETKVLKERVDTVDLQCQRTIERFYQQQEELRKHGEKLD